MAGMSGAGMSSQARREMAVLRVVGPPGSGKTLLIVSLAEALRSRGHRVATVVRRDPRANIPSDPLPLYGGGPGWGRTGETPPPTSTVIVLSNGSRVTMEGAPGLDRLRQVVPSIDPSVHLLLAEGYVEPGSPAVALAPDGRTPSDVPPEDLLAVVASEEIAGAFARFGPGETHGLADLVERALLGVTREPSEATSRRGRIAAGIARAFGRVRRGGR